MKKTILLLSFLLISVPVIFAGNPAITSVTMNPPNPSFGDAVQITVTYCGGMYIGHMLAIAISTQSARDNADLSGTGQVFVVSRAGVDVPTSQPALAPGGEIGYVAQTNPGGGTPDCPTCGSGSNDGISFTKIYNVHIPPASYFPGCANNTLYLHAGMKDNSIGAGEWQGLPACQANSSNNWTMPLLPKGFTMSKRAEGVLQLTNDLVLYSIDYEYWNGRLLITDSIPGAGNLTLVSWGPQAMTGGTISGPAIGATSLTGQACRARRQARYGCFTE
jgi:hypothetical protein